MKRRDDAIALRQMLRYARKAFDFCQTHSRGDLDADDYDTMGMVKFLEMIGEAAGRLSDATRQQHPAIPWEQIMAFRHRLVHGYDEIDFDRVWLVLTTDLPPLIAELERMLPREQP